MAIAIDSMGDQAEVAVPRVVTTPDGRVFPVAKDMDVLGADGVRVGRLKEVRPDAAAFLVDRALHRDVYVPCDAVHAVRDNQLVLIIPADQVDAMDWPRPRLL